MKVTIVGNYGVSNIGDEIILANIKKLLKATFKEIEVFVMGKGLLFPFGVRSLIRSLVNPKLWIQPLQLIRKSDVIIVGGGGLFTDEEKVFVGGFWALQGLMAILMKRPVFVLGVSIGELNVLSRFFAKKLLRFSKIVTVRDVYSKELLDSWGIKNTLTSDFALYEIPEIVKVAKKYAVISLKYVKNSDKNLHIKIAQLCDYLITNYALDIKLLPFQSEVHNDTHISNKVFEQIVNKKHTEIVKIGEKDNWLELLHNAEIVISMRLHAGILSLRAETPFVPLSYMKKVSNFWNEFKEIESIDVNDFDVDYCLRQIEKILNNRETYVKKLIDIKHKLRQRLLITEELLKEKLPHFVKE